MNTRFRFLRLLGAVIVLMLAGVRPGAAASPTPPPLTAEERDFERKIRVELTEMSPAAVKALDDADRARDVGDLDGAARGYEDVLKQAPRFFHAERRLCGVEAFRDHRDRALPLCRHALQMKDTPENHASLASALLSVRNPPQSDLDEAGQHAKRAVYDKPQDKNVQSVMCRYAMAASNPSALKDCSAALVRIDGSDPFAHLFASISAGTEGRLDEADDELERAHTLGLPDDIYKGTKEQIEKAQPSGPKYLRWCGFTLAAWLALFGILFVAGSLLSASAMRASSRPPPKGDGHPHGVEAALRRMYRVVLWISCGFYYVSLPLLAVFMVALALGIGYGFLMVGRIPIKLVLIIGLAVISTLVAIVRSLFIRGRDHDPGERIDLEAHPRMRQVLDEVAARIGTRPVDHVYLTPFTDIAVLERGGMARQLRGSTERALVLGAGVLDGMKLRAFKGILAHEYGHFHNEDTAGGGFALAVRRSVLTMAAGLAERGQASSLNPAWWFVRGFHSVFLRISQGASRLQEVLADRWAAFAYGSAAFEEGMRHVVRRSLAFDAHADRTLAEVLEHKRGLANLYRYTPEVQAVDEDVEKAFEEAWNAAPSPYDSHPRPSDRIEWVRALGAAGSSAAADDDDDAWTLFADRAAVEEHMTGVVRLRVADAMGVHVPDGGAEATDNSAG